MEEAGAHFHVPSTSLKNGFCLPHWDCVNWLCSWPGGWLGLHGDRSVLPLIIYGTSRLLTDPTSQGELGGARWNVSLRLAQENQASPPYAAPVTLGSSHNPPTASHPCRLPLLLKPRAMLCTVISSPCAGKSCVTTVGPGPWGHLQALGRQCSGAEPSGPMSFAYRRTTVPFNNILLRSQCHGVASPCQVARLGVQWVPWADLCTVEPLIFVRNGWGKRFPGAWEHSLAPGSLPVFLP